jgi:hypothetical protein
MVAEQEVPMSNASVMTSSVRLFRLSAAAAAIALVALPSLALAQSGGASGSSAGSKQAPVGHRQPTPATIKADKANANNATDFDAEDKALDRKIRNICRGC